MTHPLQISIVGCALDQGLINRIWARKIVQLQIYIYIYILLQYIYYFYGKNIILVLTFFCHGQFSLYILVAINLVPFILNLQLIWSLLLTH